MTIFGGYAAGKTHLLHAVKNAIEQNTPELKVIITTAAEMHSSLESILSSGGTAEQFRERYMQADALLVDDIQEFAGKMKTQNELILLFDRFYGSAKRFMMTSSQREPHICFESDLKRCCFWGEFAVITRAYIKGQFEIDRERNDKRDALLIESEHIYRILGCDRCDLEDFKATPHNYCRADAR